MAEDIRPEGAVRAAKKWLAAVYAEERIDKIGLEEIRWRDGNWEVTLGFNRNFHEPDGVSPMAELHELYARRRRDFKIVVVAGDDNHVMELRDREVA